MKAKHAFFLVSLLISTSQIQAELPGPIEGGYLLPNGWRITPLGDAVETNDLIMNLVPTPDGKRMVALHSGYNPHGLLVIDIAKREAVQRIPLPTSWLGLAWHPKGKQLYVSGGNASRTKKKNPAPIYTFEYSNGRLSEKPVSFLRETIAEDQIYWSGLVHHPKKDLLFAANKTAGNIVVFDTKTRELLKRIPVEVDPYDLVLTEDGSTLYCSNWASDSVSVIDTETLKVKATISVGDNPNDMVLSEDGRLFVACSNDNSVVVIDLKKQRVIETIVTSLYEQAPEGSTPNALALDSEGETLYVANADNNNVCVINVEDAGESVVMGFIPTGWYPSALALDPSDKNLFIGNGKGLASSATVKGPRSPIASAKDEIEPSTKSTVHGSVNIMKTADYRNKLRELTKQAYANCPYNDELLANARSYDGGPTVVPSTVGLGSAIKHVIYIIKENRTYDQVLGDLPQGNGDPRLTIFGEKITPNIHALVQQFVLLDNLYCDAEVSVDGHQWSNAAYATDFVEKHWPARYGKMSDAPYNAAAIPSAGYLWDQCARKGLTYRSYGENAHRVSESDPMESTSAGLVGHVAPNYLNWGARDTENAAEFIREFDEYERNYDHPNPEKRLPQFIVMGLPEDHTKGSEPGAPTIFAAVASNDQGLGMIVERVSHSRYWPETAIFVIEDDSQNGPDHVDARRTVGLVISPYTKHGYVDSTFYTTSSMLRTIELLLGLPPMSQYDAAANPMYASLTLDPNPAPYSKLPANIDINELNSPTAWGAEESLKMDFSSFDLTPMFALNEIIWKNARGPDSEMPLPVSRFAASSLK
jgi:YVTN family beta-propeller protein